MKVFRLKPFVNKRNGQISLLLPKLKLPKKKGKDIIEAKSFKLRLEDIEW